MANKRRTAGGPMLRALGMFGNTHRFSRKSVN
jgi:hypothetical protein